MYFFKGGKDGLPRSGFNAWRPDDLPGTLPLNRLFAGLNGEERPQSVAALLLILVGLVHGWVALGLLKPDTPTKPKPQIIEVSLLAAPVQQAKAAPPAPPAAEKKPVRQQALKPKTQPRKKPSVIPQKIRPPKPKPVLDEPHPSLAPTVPAPVAKPESAQDAGADTPGRQASAPQAGHGATGGISANKSGDGERVTCVYCPQIKYPRAAQRRNLQGSVQLRLALSADGSVQEATIMRSSGHELLDESALANVRKWRFVPGQAGVVRMATQLINFKM